MHKKIINFFIIVLLLLVLGSCNSGDEDIKEHISFDSKYSPYIIMKGESYYILSFDNKKEKTTTFDLFLNIDNYYNESSDEFVEYELKLINAVNEEIIFKSKSPSKLPITKQMIYSSNIGGNGLKEIFLKIIDSKEHNFYEEALQKTNENILTERFADDFINEDISFDIIVIDEEDKYNIQFVFDAKENFHLDFQSFLFSKDREVFSFLEIYGYSRNIFPYTVNDNYIHKDMNIVYLYTRIFYYDNNYNKHEIRTRFLLEDLTKKG